MPTLRMRSGIRACCCLVMKAARFRGRVFRRSESWTLAGSASPPTGRNPIYRETDRLPLAQQ